MSDERQIPIYEIPPDALRRPWVSRSFLRFIQARRAVPRQRIGSAVGAAVLAALAHALLIGSVIWGTSQPPVARAPLEQGPGSTGLVSDQEPMMTLILINDQSVRHRSETTDEQPLASRGFAPGDLLVTLLSPLATPAFDFSDAQARREQATDEPAPATDSALRALLFGRYVGQIRARIERAWLRPRTPIGARSFACRVQITQDRSRNVRETTLQKCNGDTRWQLSLVRAIQAASPLPAPPDPKVFADALVLEFDATGYVTGGPKEGFEPAGMTVASNSTTAAELSEFGRQLATGRRGDKNAPGVIDLHITGSSAGARPGAAAEPGSNSPQSPPIPPQALTPQ